MKLVELKDASPQLRDQAWGLFESSFPDYERWGSEAFARAMEAPGFNTKIAVDDRGELLALLYYWLYDDVLYVEFIAVNPAMRGQNIGSRLIGKLIEENPGRKIILEIDPPEDEISIRRRGFYERLGFVLNDYEHIHPSYVSGPTAHPHRLIMMSYGGPMSKTGFARFREFLLGFLKEYGD